MSLQVLKALVEETSPRTLVSSATLTTCFKDLLNHKLIIKKKKKYEPTEKGTLLINLIESEIEEQKEEGESEEQCQ